MSPDRSLSITISLALRDQPGLDRLLHDQQDPSSPQYHRWLTPSEFVSRFGPTDSEISALSSWLAGQGFSVDTMKPGSTQLHAKAGVAQAERAFSITMLSTADGRLFGNASPARVPARFSSIIGDIRGLDNLGRAQPNFVRTSSSRNGRSPDYRDQSGYFTGFGPADVYTFYDETPLLAAGNVGGKNDCAAVTEVSDFYPEDISAFASWFQLPDTNVTTVYPDGSSPGQNGAALETLIDIDWAHAIAPGAPIRAYIGSGPNNLADAISAAVTDNLCGSIDISFGYCGEPDTFFTGTLDPLFKQAALQGQSIFVSSGDVGAAEYVWDQAQQECVPGTTRGVNEMSADPFVTSIGGTEFRPRYDRSGNDVGRKIEHTWNERFPIGPNSFARAATGGGQSAIFSKPGYQQGPGVTTDGKRDVPDIAAAAGVLAPGFFYAHGGVLECCVGGTSIGAAMWTGIAKLLADQDIAARGGNGRLGNLNPRIYVLGAQRDPKATGIRDVVSGGNSFKGVRGFAAHRGSDLTTGWGTPDLGIFVPAFVSGNASLEPRLGAIPHVPAIGADSASISRQRAE